MKWATVQISEFCKTGTGGTPSRSNMERYYEGGTIPWVKSGELRENIITGTGEHVTETALRETSIKLVPAGALLLALYGATVGRLGILGVEATTNQAVCHIIPDPKKANVRYLFHALSNQVSNLVARGVGGAQPNISQGIVKELGLMLPPLAEQKRIAAILDAADALRAKRREALAQLDALLQSTVLTLFGDPVTNPMGWEAKPLDELCTFLSGYAWKASAFNSDKKGNPVIRIQNVGTQSTDFIFTTENPIDRFWIKRGDLLLSLSGSFRLAAWNGPPALLNQRIVKLTPPQKSLSVSFFEAALSRHLGAIESMGRHALVNNVALSDLKQVSLILPPLPLQQKFAAIVESIERQKTTQRAHLAELDALFAALQHRAFRGEL